MNEDEDEEDKVIEWAMKMYKSLNPFVKGIVDKHMDRILPKPNVEYEFTDPEAESEEANEWQEENS